LWAHTPASRLNSHAGGGFLVINDDQALALIPQAFAFARGLGLLTQQ
jgi:hypothetical protein